MVYITPKVLPTRKVGSRDADASKNASVSQNILLIPINESVL